MRNATDLNCRNEQRRTKTRAAPLNGLDYLELSEDQRHLTVYFLGKAPPDIARENIRIEGGRRVRDIQITGFEVHRQEDPAMDDSMTLTVDRYGDFSTYTLCLIEVDERGLPNVERVLSGRSHYKPLRGFDPRYACLDFSFKAGCPSDFDCRTEAVCPPPERAEPEINYLAKDYAGFRQLLLDRLALTLPDWQERHVPDLGITLVEILAYVGDHLSYYQDAVATEAYLDTARQRVSVRRHTRLVDYVMHEGCNARSWLFVATDRPFLLERQQAYFITRYNDALTSGQPLTPEELPSTLPRTYEVFEPLIEQSTLLLPQYNEIYFYTWGDSECCLAKGATYATLTDEWEPAPATGDVKDSPKQCPEPAPPQPPPEPGRKLKLQVGDFLLFEEITGPITGVTEDADPRHRHVVRLTRVTPAIDPLNQQPIVDIEWAAEDQLPFTLCLSAVGRAPECRLLSNISVARGNVLLVDHGETIVPDEPLGKVPMADVQGRCECAGQPPELIRIAERFRPTLAKSPLTFSQTLPANAPASGLLQQDPRAALPHISLHSIPAAGDGLNPLFQPDDLQDPSSLAARLKKAADPTTLALRGRLSKTARALIDQYGGAGDTSSNLPEALRTLLRAELAALLQDWTPVGDLLQSRPHDYHFVVEIDNDGRARLRFGDGELGRQPEAGSEFLARYRVGNGPSGNVGAQAVSQLVLRSLTRGVSLRPRNPFAAAGGTAPEPLAEVKLFAPHAFRKVLQRAITAEDYAEIVMRDFKTAVQRAAAILRWTGSGYEVLVAVDPFGQEAADQELLHAIRCRLYRYRRIGHDLAVHSAQRVPLDIVLHVCVKPHYLRGEVKAALLDIFSNRLLPNGTRGFFHPDNLSFGDDVYLSKLVAVAQAVIGVESVEVTKLQRLGEAANGEIADGALSLAPLEIARLDNDPRFPENGRLQLNLGGGR